MSNLEKVSVERKGRPLENALKSERDRGEFGEDEMIQLGLLSFLSNGPGRDLSKDGEISPENIEKLRYEAEAAKRAGINVDLDQDPAEIYYELSDELDMDQKAGRSFLNSIQVGDILLSGRDPYEDPLDSSADLVYFNIDQVLEEVPESVNRLEEAALGKADDFGLNFAFASRHSKVEWSLLKQKWVDESKISEIVVPDYVSGTVGKILGRNYPDREVITFSEAEDEYDISLDDIEDEEELPWEVLKGESERIAVAYITDSGETAEKYGNSYSRKLPSYLVASEPSSERSSIKQIVQKAINPQDYREESSTADLLIEGEAAGKVLEEEEELRNADDPDEDGYESEASQALWAVATMMADSGFSCQDIYQSLQSESKNPEKTERNAKNLAGAYRAENLTQDIFNEFVESVYAFVEENGGSKEGVLDEL